VLPKCWPGPMAKDAHDLGQYPTHPIDLPSSRSIDSPRQAALLLPAFPTIRDTPYTAAIR